jgi:hypothetical protein
MNLSSMARELARATSLGGGIERRRRSGRRLSLLGYLILNLAAAAILLGVYYFAASAHVGLKPLTPLRRRDPLHLRVALFRRGVGVRRDV